MGQILKMLKKPAIVGVILATRPFLRAVSGLK